MVRIQKYKYDPIQHFNGLLSGVDNSEAILNIYPLLERFPKNIYLEQQILYYRGENTKLIDRILSNREININNIYNKNWVFSAEKHYKKDEVIQGNFVLVPGSKQNIYRIISISTSKYWVNIVQRIVRRLYPIGMRVFFKQNEIQKALIEFNDAIAHEHRVHILEATLKSERYIDSHLSINKFNTDRVWRDQPIKEMFDIAVENNQWFSSVSLAIQKKYKNSNQYHTIANVKINKYGELKFNNYFQEIDDSIITPLESEASERLDLFQNRGIRERNFKASPPLVIEYNNDIFNDINELHHFGDILLKYPDSSKAVYHGNPYYHSSIADYIDGSSFDIWILSPSRVFISPQVKASPQALERLTSYIFYEFREGIINEYQQQES